MTNDDLDNRPQGGTVVPFRRNNDQPTGEAAGTVVPGEVVTPVDAPEPDATSWWSRTRTARRRRLVPAWLFSRRELVSWARWLAMHVAYTAAFHLLRLPLYAGRVASTSPRGAARVAVHAFRWVTDADAAPLRMAAISRTDDAQWLKLEADRQRKTRTRLAVVSVAALVVTVTILAVWLAETIAARIAVAAGVVGILGWIGRSADTPVIGRAVVTAKAAKLTSDVVVRALAALGISQITQAVNKGPGITFPAPIMREGRGWRAEVDLPYGVTAVDVMERRDKLASGLRRPLGCVWPEPVTDEHSGRLVIWVADTDMAKTAAASWPLARKGSTDVFGSLPFGTDQRGRPVGVDLMYASVVIGAMPRMGKTFALRVLVLGAALDATAELRLYELKGTGDLAALEPIAHDYASGADASTLRRTLEGLMDLHAELEKRSKVIAGLPRDVCPENKITPELAGNRRLGLHPIVVAIDECQELFADPDYGKEAARLATAIIKRGPAMGIMLILATQRPDAASLPPGISANAGIRFCLRVMGQTENDMVLGTSAYRNGIRATTFTNKDKGIGYLVGATDDPTVVRSYYVDAQDAETVVTRAKALREKAGTITGHAAGEPRDGKAGETSSVLSDVAAVLRPGEDKVWSETVVDRLAALRPGVYGPWAEWDARGKANQLASALKPYGVDTRQVHRADEDGRRANRRGITRADVQNAIARHSSGGDG